MCIDMCLYASSQRAPPVRNPFSTCYIFTQPGNEAAQNAADESKTIYNKAKLTLKFRWGCRFGWVLSLHTGFCVFQQNCQPHKHFFIACFDGGPAEEYDISPLGGLHVVRASPTFYGPPIPHLWSSLLLPGI